MKTAKFFFLTLALLLATACGNRQQEADVDLIYNPNSANGYDETVQTSVLTFDETSHDFGRLSAGETISYSFHFRNTGNADLIISGTNATCGCTVADYPKGRIAPGGDGYLTVSFNSAGKAGQQYQEVTVVSNAQPNRARLSITAQVGR